MGASKGSTEQSYSDSELSNFQYIVIVHYTSQSMMKQLATRLWPLNPTSYVEQSNSELFSTFQMN